MSTIIRVGPTLHVEQHRHPEPHLTITEGDQTVAVEVHEVMDLVGALLRAAKEVGPDADAPDLEDVDREDLDFGRLGITFTDDEE